MAEDFSPKINIKCIFCQSTEFELAHKGYIPSEGESIKCANCGKYNDFSSLKSVLVEEGKNMVAEHIKNRLKNLNRK